MSRRRLARRGHLLRPALISVEQSAQSAQIERDVSRRYREEWEPKIKSAKKSSKDRITLEVGPADEHSKSVAESLVRLLSDKAFHYVGPGTKNGQQMVAVIF